MTDDQPTMPGFGKWPRDHSEAPTQLPEHKAPTPPTLPAEDVKAWSPPPPPANPPFRPSPEPPPQPPLKPASQPSADKTVLIRTEPESQTPLAWLVIIEGPGGKRGTVLALKAETIVGRTSGDYLVDGDSTVSSQHIKIRLEAPEEAAEEADAAGAEDAAGAAGAGAVRTAGAGAVRTAGVVGPTGTAEAGAEIKTIFVLYDQASSNGTFVGNKQNYRDDESRVYRRVLQDGDYVLLGNTTLVFKQVE